MRKKVSIVIAATLAAAGMVYAAQGFKCMTCNGTGWNGQFRCSMCGGDGVVGN